MKLQFYNLVRLSTILVEEEVFWFNRFYILSFYSFHVHQLKLINGCWLVFCSNIGSSKISSSICRCINIYIANFIRCHDARGCILGLTQQTEKRHIVRAFMESIAFQIYETLESIVCDLNIKRICSIKVDGGMSKNSPFIQVTLKSTVWILFFFLFVFFYQHLSTVPVSCYSICSDSFRCVELSYRSTGHF